MSGGMLLSQHVASYQLHMTCSWPWPLTSLWGGGGGREHSPAENNVYLWCCCLFSYLHPSADKLLCGLLFWELSKSTPGWFTTGKDPHPPSTHTHKKQTMMQQLDSWFFDPEHLRRRSWSDSWVILRLFAWNHDPHSQPAGMDGVAMLQHPSIHPFITHNCLSFGGSRVELIPADIGLETGYTLEHRDK